MPVVVDPERFQRRQERNQRCVGRLQGREQRPGATMAVEVVAHGRALRQVVRQALGEVRARDDVDPGEQRTRRAGRRVVALRGPVQAGQRRAQCVGIAGIAHRHPGMYVPVGVDPRDGRMELVGALAQHRDRGLLAVGQHAGHAGAAPAQVSDEPVLLAQRGRAAHPRIVPLDEDFALRGLHASRRGKRPRAVPEDAQGPVERRIARRQRPHLGQGQRGPVGLGQVRVHAVGQRRGGIRARRLGHAGGRSMIRCGTLHWRHARPIRTGGASAVRAPPGSGSRGYPRHATRHWRRRMSPTIEHETLVLDAAGMPCSARYGDRFASRAGALGQARHVFLGGNGLPRRWAGRRQFVIVETGFGLGNNFLACWQAWHDDPARPRQLHFVSVEKHPLRPEDLAQAGGSAVGGSDDVLRERRAELVAQWPLPLAGLHRLSFESGRVLLTLALGDARDLVPQLALGADAIFLDGFAPECNPQMWEADLMRALARLARPDATAATYTAAGAVREALAAQGFSVQRQPGFGLKRHMLSGPFAPRWKMRRHEPRAPYTGEQRALIVGAGLAGCATALALARRGWQVTLLDQATGPGGGASGLPAGLLRPLLSVDDNLASRLSRAAYGHARRALAEAAGHASAPIARHCGVFQQALDEADEQAWRERLARRPLPPGFARYADAATAATHLGLRPRRGGLWFAEGAVVDGGRWCAAMLAQAQVAAARADGRLDVRWACTAAALEGVPGRWQVRDAAGGMHDAPVLILANAAGLAGLLDHEHLPLESLAGELTLLAAPALEGLKAAIGGDGYAIPPLLGRAVVGATYELAGAPAGTASATAGAANLARLPQLLAEPPAVAAAGAFRAQRCVSPDRLPLAGALVDEARVRAHVRAFAGAHLSDLPRLAGLYCLAALGSRGLTLAPLLGEIIAAAVTGEPAPVETALCNAVDPARYLLRHLRSGPAPA